MKEKSRELYGFSIKDRQFARVRANGKCEFPAEVCPSPNTGRVNHLTGCGIARLLDLDPEPITDPELNAVLLCREHQDDLDQQEKVIYEAILEQTPRGHTNNDRISYRKRSDPVAA